MTLPVEVVKGRAQPAQDLLYSPSGVTLYGVKLGGLAALIGPQAQPAQASISIITQGSKTSFIACLIYAFAYQGHVYNLPEPVVLMLPDNGKPAEGYEFDSKYYQMWNVDKLDRTLQLESTADTFEEIVLKRALMGTKQPISYASRALISHRGGKLTE